MSGKNTTVQVVKINAQAENLAKALATLKKDFQGLVVPPELDKIITKLENSIAAVQRKTEKGIVPREVFLESEKEIGKIKTAFDNLHSTMNSFKDLSDKKLFSMLPEGVKQKLDEINKAYEDYEKTLAGVLKIEKEVEAATEKRISAQQKLEAAERSRDSKSNALDVANKEFEKHQEVTEAIKKQAAATKELEQAEKDLANAKQSGKSEKSIANRQAKVDSARERQQAAKAVVDAIDPDRLKAQEAALRAVAQAEKEYSAAKREIIAEERAKTQAEVAEANALERLQEARKQSQTEGSKEAAALEQMKKALAEVLPKYKNLVLEGDNAGEQLSNLRKIISQLNDKELNKLRQSLNASSENFSNFGEEVEGLKGALTTVKEEQKSVDEAFSRKEAFENKIRQFLGLSGAAQVLRSSLRDAMQTITELDATMTEMAVVTDLTVGDYWDQLPEYSKRASELGVSINDAYKSATLYYQQGLKTNEVNAISVETLKMAKIANMDAADATDKMTAALRGFNMELNETGAKRVSDVYSELAAITAADTKEIANAMTKTASIAHSAGMEFETTAAFLAQIVETTRESAETAGTAMKTVIARFQELKKSPDEIGEVDGEIVDANAIESALRSVGVSLRDTNGQFRELDDVFLELSSKWDTLDKNTQRYIATIAAGSRQQSRFIAMMSDYSRTQELVDAANSSAGASNQQFEKTMDSLSAKLEKLKNAWHEFTMGIVDSDLVKTGVDILTKFLEIINKATSSFGSMGNAITKVIGTLAIFKLGRKIFDQFSGPISDLFSKIAEDASSKGYLAGRNWATGAKQGGQDVVEGKEQAIPTEEKKEKAGFFGVQAFKRASTLHQEKTEAKKIIADNRYKSASKTLERMDGDYTFGKNGQVYEKGTGRKGALPKKEADNIKAQYADLTEKAETYEKATKDVGETSKKYWKAVGEGIGAVGSQLTGVGTATAMIGGIVSSMGLEDLGETISGIGQGVMILGTAISAIPPLLTLITSHPIVALITVVLGIALAGILMTLKEIAKNTPEGKLKAAQENAEKAAEAAEKLTNSYQNLNKSINDLDDKYKALDDLTRGTEEWNKAVQEINDSVLELIEEYPQLAEFMENKDGVLTLALDDEELQNVIIQAKTAAVVAQNTSKVANAQVAMANTRKTISDVSSMTFNEAWQELGGWSWDANMPWLASIFETLFIQPFDAISLANKYNSAIDTIKGKEEKYAEALASGVLVKDTEGKYSIGEGMEDQAKELLGFTKITEDIQQALKELGQELLIAGKELKVYNSAKKAEYEAIANNIKQLINLDNLSKKDQGRATDYINNLLTGEDYEKIYEDELSKVGVLDSGEIADLLQRMYGVGYTYDEETKEIKDSSGQVVRSNVTQDTLKAEEANWRATKRFQTAGESIFDTIDTVKLLAPEGAGDLAIERLFSDAGGLDLTQSDLGQLKELNNKEALEKIWGGFTQAQLDVFGGDINNLQAYIQNAIDNASEIFGEGAKLEKVTAGQHNSLMELVDAIKMSDVENGEANSEAFVGAFNKLASSNSMTDEQAAIFARELAVMSKTPYTREKWEGLLQAFTDYGIPVSDDMRDFVNNTMAATNASYSDKWMKEMGVSDKLITNYGAAIASKDSQTVERFHSTFQKWRENWATANDESAKAQHELITQVAERLIENFEKQIEEQENLYDAITEGNDKLLNKMQQSVDEDRQAREEAETEADIQNMYSELAYLQQDTSGANALEMLALQEEIANAEQDYQDVLVDQKLQEFADANALASEQRERQIELLQLQLEQFREKDVYQIAKEVVQSALVQLEAGIPVDESALGAIFKDTIFASNWEEADFWTKISESLSIIAEEKKLRDPEEIKNKIISKLQKDIDDGKITSREDRAIEAGFNEYVGAMHAAGHGAINLTKEDFANSLSFKTNSNEDKRNEAIQNGLQAIMAKDAGGKRSQSYQDAKKAYEDAEGSPDDFDDQVGEYAKTNEIGGSSLYFNGSEVITGSFPGGGGFSISGGWTKNYNGDDDTGISISLPDGRIARGLAMKPGHDEGDLINTVLNHVTGGTGQQDKWLAMYGGKPYAYRNGGWRELYGGDVAHVIQVMKNVLNGTQYKTGGLASFTGPAWLDGTPSKPEYVLNAAQTERFFSLIDVLESFNKSDSTPVKSGDNYFDIEINVEKLENDYDVEQVADKIRRMIYDDASYRNVNTINLIR